MFLWILRINGLIQHKIVVAKSCDKITFNLGEQSQSDFFLSCRNVIIVKLKVKNPPKVTTVNQMRIMLCKSWTNIFYNSRSSATTKCFRLFCISIMLYFQSATSSHTRLASYWLKISISLQNVGQISTLTKNNNKFLSQSLFSRELEIWKISKHQQTTITKFLKKII